MPTNSPLAGINVLIVEDRFIVAELHRQMIEAAGATVLGPAPNVERALHLSESADIHAALLDVDLAGATCFELVDRLRDRGTCVVFCTGFDRQQLPARYHDLPLFEKPIDYPSLINGIGDAARHPGSGAGLRSR